MTKGLLLKILGAPFVDTRKYRYVTRCASYDGVNAVVEIMRLPKKSLGTTDAIDKWETVRVIRDETAMM